MKTTTTATPTYSKVVQSSTFTTPKPTVVITTESTEDKLCELPMDVDNVYGSQISSLPTISASSNQPEDIANKPWSPSTEDLASDNDAWVQIEFEQPVYIFGLTVKGAGLDTGKFVSKVKVDYKLDTSSDEPSEEFTPVSSENDDDTFTANVDDSQMSSIYFTDKQPVLVTSIRVHPVEWTGDEPAIKIALLGCYKTIETTTEIKTTTEIVTTTEPVIVEEATTTSPAVVSTTSSQEEVTTVVSTMATKETTTEAPVEITTSTSEPVDTTTVYEVESTTVVVETTSKPVATDANTGKKHNYFYLHFLFVYLLISFN